MATSESLAPHKLGRFTWAEIGLVLSACLVPVHLWAIYNLLDILPAWLLRLELGEVMGLTAYVLTFALIESLFVVALVLLVGNLTPRRWLAGKFVPLASLLIFVHSLWAMAITLGYDLIRTWSALQFIPLLILYLLSVGVCIVSVWRLPKFEAALVAFLHRLAVLAAIYLFFDVLSVMMVILRNLR